MACETSGWVLITEQFGHQQAHRVADEEYAFPRCGGRFQALCGRLITPAPLMAPIGRPCLECADVHPRERRGGVGKEDSRWSPMSMPRMAK
jgi:hypothetical protein